MRAGDSSGRHGRWLSVSGTRLSEAIMTFAGVQTGADHTLDIVQLLSPDAAVKLVWCVPCQRVMVTFAGVQAGGAHHGMLY